MSALTPDQVFDQILLPLIVEVEEEIGQAIAKDRTTPLLGGESPLDSLALVTFLITVEEQIEEESGQPVRLVDERAMSRNASPFRTLGTLADHISEELSR